MKCKRFIGLLIPMLFCVAFVGKSQEAKMLPTLAVGNKWNMYQECDAIVASATESPKKIGVDKTTYHYTIEREVEMDGKKYFEVLRDGKLRFFMREDLTTGKVYRKYPEKEEVLIFDYDLREGDVFIWENEPLRDSFKKLRMKVISISNKEIKGVNRRVYQLAFAPYRDDESHQGGDPFGKYTKGDPIESHPVFFLDTGFWIEGIGGNQGLGAVKCYDLVGGNCTCEELLCFTDAKGETYQRFPKEGCEINYKVPRAIETPLLSKTKIVSSGGQLRISLEDVLPHTVSVYDMSGQLLAREERFVGSMVLRLPALGEKSTVLIRLDDESTLYTL